MQQTQEVTHTNCLSHEVSIIFPKFFFAKRIVNVWNGLPPSVIFASHIFLWQRYLDSFFRKNTKQFQELNCLNVLLSIT